MPFSHVHCLVTVLLVVVDVTVLFVEVDDSDVELFVDVDVEDRVVLVEVDVTVVLVEVDEPVVFVEVDDTVLFVDVDDSVVELLLLVELFVVLVVVTQILPSKYSPSLLLQAVHFSSPCVGHSQPVAGVPRPDGTLHVHSLRLQMSLPPSTFR